MAYVGGKQLSGHAWVECYIGGQWVDYDAALDGFDVAHLALWTGAGELDGRDILAKFGHLQVTQVQLELPWYMRWAWPMAILGGLLLIAWVLYRRYARRRQPTDWPAFAIPQTSCNSPHAAP